MKTQSMTMQQNVLKTLMAFGFLMTLSLFTNTMNAQTTGQTVTGVVKSTDGVVPMATVVLKGTQIWTSCDENGAFIFPQKLKENDVLLVTSLGYQDAEVKITENTTFVKPFLEDIELVIIGALRTKPTDKTLDLNKK
ncbi:carboxypeptidase-like regulatory domain-containing protein [uncultured Dokdonia sp.]|uniref:carboxypeptidase-like regulatory domain-containing protein n=1 Tax=uncultured Dokdonia sp. TaxID=575653 RepID=UPI0026393598|nr:carboxypeptidase-like regulatory domain-containing protein [uncultured Dokdonia sp.]